MKLILALQKSDNTVFTISDLQYIWADADITHVKQYASYHAKRGNIERLQKGVYKLADRDIDLLELGNKLRTPSYISFETALFEYGVIFQWDQTITVATTNTESMEVAGNNFKYRKLKETILLNNSGIIKKGNYHVASLERAFLDILYLDSSFYIDNPRSIDFEKAKKILPLYGSETLIKILEKWERYAQSQ